jgi:hypothetical protein
MPRLNFFLLLLFLFLLRARAQLSSTTRRKQNSPERTIFVNSIEDDLGLERRPFDDSLKRSSSSSSSEEAHRRRIDEELLDYHDIYRDHSHDHEHLEEGERVVHWEL